MKIEIENLKALVYGVELTTMQKMDAMNEFIYLKKRIEYLEQQINKNDVIDGVKELLFKKIDLVLEKYERDIENANDQKALDFLEYIKAKRNGAKGMANIVKRHFE